MLQTRKISLRNVLLVVVDEGEVEDVATVIGSLVVVAKCLSKDAALVQAQGLHGIVILLAYRHSHTESVCSKRPTAAAAATTSVTPTTTASARPAAQQAFRGTVQKGKLGALSSSLPYAPSFSNLDLCVL